MIARVSASSPRTVFAPPSKSLAHRCLIAAALGARPVLLRMGRPCEDVRRTADGLCALGAKISETKSGFLVVPGAPPARAEIFCGDSASTLRFLLPVAAALGTETVFTLSERLAARPHTPLLAALNAGGCRAEQTGGRITLSGRLRPGAYHVDGALSSQYRTGFLFALPLLSGESTLFGCETASAPYVAMTRRVLSLAGVRTERTEAGEAVPGGQRYALPREVTVPGDWSAAAFPLAMGFSVAGLAEDGAQGDARVLELLSRMGGTVCRADGALSVTGILHGAEIDACEIPDLVPPLAAAAAFAEGETRFVNASRLRAKESDRLAALCQTLTAFGAEARETADGLVIPGGAPLHGARIDPHGDHRIAFAAAMIGLRVGATEICGAECAAKSWPGFWRDFAIETEGA